MSSHHVVREKQEPALILANGESCRIELLQDLLEWSPLVVVLDGAIERVLGLGIKVDVLLGDFDSKKIDIGQIQEDQYPIQIVHTPNQDKTDLEKAIEYLIERGFPAANILWATGRRADHNLANITNIVRYKSKIQLAVIDDYSVVYPLSPTPNKFEKWYPAGFPISLLPVGVAKGVTTRNLVYTIDNENLTLGYKVGNSNEVKQDGLIHVSFESGDLLLMECKD